MASIKSGKSLQLDLPPSCIVFSQFPEYFVVGTYFLHRKEQDEEDEAALSSAGKGQKRTGTLELFRLKDDEPQHLQTVPIDSAILDIKFHALTPRSRNLLAVGTSTGDLMFFHLDISSSTPKLVHKQTFSLHNDGTLILAVEWCATKFSCLGISCSNGCVYVLYLQPAVSGYEISEAVVTHDLEAWTLAFPGGPGRQGVLSGGDDAALRFSSTLNPDDEDRIVWCDRKIHGAGVTAILPLEKNVIVTGSYDDHIRVIRTPDVGRREVLAEMNLDGGVWRLKSLWHGDEEGRYVVLASCMHAGTRIVELRRDQSDVWTFNVLAKFEEHKSMNYGSDVQPGHSDTKTFISTSFYDRLLCVWKHEIPDTS